MNLDASFDYRQLIAAVRRIASERPDVRYDELACSYVVGVCSDGTKGCLLGQAFRALDVVIEPADSNNGIDTLLSIHDVEIPQQYVDWLSGVQQCQDEGYPWGKCVQRADEMDRELTGTCERYECMKKIFDMKGYNQWKSV